MEKDRSTKMIAIVALIVAIFGLSLGFAAFSKNLDITSAATVKGDESRFSVKFSTNEENTSSGSVTPTLNPDKTDGFTASNADLADTTVSNLKATFTNGKGEQKATYTFYIRNDGELDAYLKKVSFAQEKPQCSTSASENKADETLVTSACEDVSVKITVDDQSYTSTNNQITDASLPKSQNKKVTVELDYNDTHPIDGDFDVTFGSITLTYSSSDK